MRPAGKHLVGDVRALQREHNADVRNQFSAVEQLCDLVQPRPTDLVRLHGIDLRAVGSDRGTYVTT
jgi:hypothetical protein